MIKFCVIERPSAAFKKPVHGVLDRRCRVVCLIEERYYFEQRDCSLHVADKPIVAQPRVRRFERLEKGSIKQLKSRVQCDGNVMRLTPRSFAKSMNSRVLWLSRSSIRRMCGLSFVHPSIDTKWRIHLKKRA